ncbi:hypothetical protein GIB67_015698 [Kingdonia uniflora]|uniref:tRNA synthetases class I catalytic domain-containing protein n=1 Tax=Kingdonia uniflora TaxID=39325 RepID=A0A7J7NU82_9MAGN|nr:hypothetical protein GIB67_015698 [Kingdonia uniflora]
MSAHYLTSSFGIHGGGMDLIFPHHENEIAQSSIVNSKAKVSYWMHNGHMTRDDKKMSKSLGNVVLIRELVPLVIVRADFRVCDYWWIGFDCGVLRCRADLIFGFVNGLWYFVVVDVVVFRRFEISSYHLTAFPLGPESGGFELVIVMLIIGFSLQLFGGGDWGLV